MAEKDSEKSIKITFSFIFRFIVALIIALFAISLFLILLYICGNYQNFQDENQAIVLTALSYTSMFLFFLILPVTIHHIFDLISRKNIIKKIIYIALCAAALCFSLAAFSFSNTINFLSRGF